MSLSDFQRTIIEGTTDEYRARLFDYDGSQILLAQIATLKLTLHLPSDTTSAGIINSRNAQDVLNLNNVTFASSSVAVTAASNASPIVITATAHGFSDGDLISVVGVTGNLAANVRKDEHGEWIPWEIEKVDANSFKLLRSTGTGAWVSGGTATKNLLTWSMQAADNDIVGAAAIDALEEHVALFEWTYGTPTKTGAHEFRHNVINLGRR